MSVEDLGLAVITPVVGWINGFLAMLLPGSENLVVLLISVVLAYWLRRKTGVKWWVFMLFTVLIYISMRYFGVGTV